MSCCGSKISSSFNGHLVGCTCSSCSTCSEAPSTLCPTIINTIYDTTVLVTSPWNIPLCQGIVQVVIPPEYTLPIGSLLWSPSYGYYEVVERSPITGQTVIRNTCLFPVASPGTAVPGCTKFIVTANPILPGQFLGVFLSSDFTAPAIGECVSVTFTTNSDVSAGLLVNVGTATYLVSSASTDGVSVVLCNQGGGFTPGTPITAIGSFGNYLYPITIGDFSLINKVSVFEDGFDLGTGFGGGVTSKIIQTPLTSIINPVSSRTLVIYGVLDGLFNCLAQGGDTDPFGHWNQIVGQTRLRDTVNPAFAFTHDQVSITYNKASSTPDVLMGVNLRQAFTMSIAPNTSETFTGWFRVITDSSADVFWNMRFCEMTISVTYMGVLV